MRSCCLGLHHEVLIAHAIHVVVVIGAIWPVCAPRQRGGPIPSWLLYLRGILLASVAPQCLQESHSTTLDLFSWQAKTVTATKQMRTKVIKTDQ